MSLTKGTELDVILSDGNVLTVTVDNESTCRGCGAPIVWGITEKGKRMPLDPPDSDEPTITHFATCPQAETFRKRRRV